MVAKPLCPLYKNIIKSLDRARYPELRYMIGTGAAKGDVMQIDLERYNPSGARKKTRSAATDSVAPSFGKATGRAFMPHAIKKLPRR